MRTLIDISDGLMKKAMQVSGTTTKKDTVEIALQELIKLRLREALKDMAATEPIDLSLKGLKAMRRSRSKKHAKTITSR
jgi:Arc/MetJ family transcription regulator